MSMVEPNNFWDGIVNGANSNEFANILNILDFPMECLEGDGTADDLDASNFQNMGPIPLDALTGVPLVSQSQVANGREIKGSSRNAPVDIKYERIEPESYVGYNRGVSTPCDSFISPKFRTFRTPSPVSFLASAGSCSSVKYSTTKPKIAIMRGTRSKRKRPSNLHCWFQTPVICSAYVANRSSNSGNHEIFNEQRLSESSNTSQDLANFSREARKESLVGFYATRAQETTPSKQSVSSQKCTHCQVKKTPQWREGPLGPKTLCNACGVRYRSGRLFPEYRPASSPTFVPSFHSNLHKKVTEMRKKTTHKDLEAEIPPMSPLPEFVPVSNYLFDPL